MTLVRRNYDFPMFNSFLDDFFAKDMNELFNAKLSVPSVNVFEQDDAYVIELAAPGYEKGDFSVDLKKDILTISSEKQVEANTEEKNFTKREFNYAAFKRSFTLPESANRDKIDAKYENGILNLRIEKKPEATDAGNRTIDIS